MHTALPQRGKSPSVVTPYMDGNHDNNDDMFLVMTRVGPRVGLDGDESQTTAPGALVGTPNSNALQRGKSAPTLGLRQGPWRRKQDPELKAALESAAITVAPPQKAKRKQKLSLAAFRSRYGIPERNLAGFLADLPDNRALSDLLLPGTHETLAYYGYPFSQCQSLKFPLESQLENGVRVLDIRLAVVNNTTLIAYHGIISQRVAFTTVLQVIQQFLNRNKTESIVMSIKQEDTKTPAKTFSTLVKEVIYSNRDLWHLEDRIPLLGEVRGKIVLFSRFNDSGAGWPNGDGGVGIHPTTWPDSYKGIFEWSCEGTRVQTQDWYSVPSFLAIPEKFELAVRPLIQSTSPPSTSTSSSSSPTPLSWPFPNQSPPPLAVSFTSASSIPLALPPTVALGFGITSLRRRFWWGRLLGWPGVNERVRDRVLLHLQRVRTLELERQREQERAVLEENRPASDTEDEKAGASSEGWEPWADVEKIRGWVLLDYVDSPNDLLPLLVECNYH